MDFYRWATRETPAQAAITKYTEWLRKGTLFSHSPEVLEVQDQVNTRAFFLASLAVFLLCPHMTKKERALVSSSFYKDTNNILKSLSTYLI